MLKKLVLLAALSTGLMFEEGGGGCGSNRLLLLGGLGVGALVLLGGGLGTANTAT